MRNEDAAENNRRNGEQDNEETEAHLAEYEPYKYSGKNYSLDMALHRPILRNMRRFAVEYLQENTTI